MSEQREPRKPILEQLTLRSACGPAKAWVQRRGHETFEAVWNDLERWDWLHWLTDCGTQIVPRPLLAEAILDAAAARAGEVEPRQRAKIAEAVAFLRNECTKTQRTQAGRNWAHRLYQQHVIDPLPRPMHGLAGMLENYSYGRNPCDAVRIHGGLILHAPTGAPGIIPEAVAAFRARLPAELAARYFYGEVST